ncbi:hypothetical protein JCM6882_005758 [Rhodosporidiobolus microsporus]
MFDVPPNDSPSSSPTDLLPHRPRASFSSLPPELKIAIALDVRLVSEAWRAERCARGKRPEHAKNTLPRVQSRIQSLNWSHVSILAMSGRRGYDVGYGMREAKLSRGEHDLFKRIKELQPGSREPTVIQRRSLIGDALRLRALERLVDFITKSCTQLKAVTYSNWIEGHILYPRLSDDTIWPDQARIPLVGAVSGLESISLSNMPGNVIPADLLPVLDGCPTIRSVELFDNGFDGMGTDDRLESLVARLFSLRTLELLTLYIPFPLHVANHIAVFAPLKTLSLHGHALEVFRAFEPFILGVASTLQVLELLPSPLHLRNYCVQPYDDTDDGTSSLHLPHLKRLIFASAFPYTLLPSFSLPSLVTVRLEDSTGRGRDPYPLASQVFEDSTSSHLDSSILSFLSAHSSTLQRVELVARFPDGDASGGGSPFEPVERFCEEHGIQYVETRR